MLEIDNCSLVIVDVQGKLAQIMYEKEASFKEYSNSHQSRKYIKHSNSLVPAGS